jgi:hypothetical protein
MLITRWSLVAKHRCDCHCANQVCIRLTEDTNSFRITAGGK